ncbi:hypothetical protein [Streptomyces sp. NPDC051561]|uniref:hypothetical protein n=1 Tax=Streptomyces sp. NPDC051561 TaxID=3365658 RepID=UPI003799CDC7
MSYRYRCGQCRTTSPPVATRRAAEAEGAWHRAREHSGHHPDDESVGPDHENELGVGAALALLLLGCLIVAACNRLI